MITDLMAIGFLVILEGLLSFDNALALAAMVKHLPKDQQKKALTYGIYGAFIFRFASLFVVTWLMQAMWVKFVGGAYLIFLSLQYFIKMDEPQQDEKGFRISMFWKTVLLVELTDIAFSIDSILAAVAVSSKFYVIVTGGILGIIAMRFAATVFIKLIDKFPRLETTAYLLVGTVGIKLIIEGFQHVDFEHGLAFWIFWSVMGSSLVYGFTLRKQLEENHENVQTVQKSNF